jgi:hypothetical protein
MKLLSIILIPPYPLHGQMCGAPPQSLIITTPYPPHPGGQVT